MSHDRNVTTEAYKRVGELTDHPGLRAMSSGVIATLEVMQKIELDPCIATTDQIVRICHELLVKTAEDHECEGGYDG